MEPRLLKISPIGSALNGLFVITVIPIGLIQAVTAPKLLTAFVLAAIWATVLEIHGFVISEVATSRRNSLQPLKRAPALGEVLTRVVIFLVVQLAFHQLWLQTQERSSARNLVLGAALIVNATFSLLTFLSARTTLTVHGDTVVLRNLFHRFVVRREDVARVEVPTSGIAVPAMVMRDGRILHIDAFSFAPAFWGFRIQPEELRKLETTILEGSAEQSIDVEKTHQGSPPHFSSTAQGNSPISQLQGSSFWKDRVLRGYLLGRFMLTGPIMVFAVAIAIGAVADLQSARVFERTASTAQGTIIGKTDHCRRVAIAFRPPQGPEVRATAPVFDCRPYRIGQSVDILFDPQNPRRVGLTAEPFDPGPELLFSGALFLFGFVPMLRAWRWARRLVRIAKLKDFASMRGRIGSRRRRFLLWQFEDTRPSLLLFEGNSDKEDSPIASILLIKGQDVDDLSWEFPVAVKGDIRSKGVFVGYCENRILWPKRRAQAS